MEEINLKEILSYYVNISDGYISDFSGESFCPIEAIEVAMIDFGKQLLKLAAENAEIKTESLSTGDYSWFERNKVYKQSIINTINQIK